MRAGTEINWVLEGKPPDQIPMARLAEYMQHLAVMFGEIQSVHFERVQEGSTVLVSKADLGGPAQRVHARVRAVAARRAPAEAMRAFRKINEMVAADGTRARLAYQGAVILRFPGRLVEEESQVSITETGSITGRLYSLLEESPGQLRARIRPRDGNGYIPCTVEPHIARELRNHFMEAVRAVGRGTWARNDGGQWICRSLHIESVMPVRDVPLRDAINTLREIEADWPDDPLGDWAILDERSGAA
jgi:hypothetical protein